MRFALKGGGGCLPKRNHEWGSSLKEIIMINIVIITITIKPIKHRYRRQKGQRKKKHQHSRKDKLGQLKRWFPYKEKDVSNSINSTTKAQRDKPWEERGWAIAARESQDRTLNSFLRILTSHFVLKVFYFFVKYTGNYVFRCLLTICTNPDTLPKLKLPDLCVEIQHL